MTIEEFNEWMDVNPPPIEDIQQRMIVLKKRMTDLWRRASQERLSAPVVHVPYTVSVSTRQLRLPGMENTLLTATIWPSDRVNWGLIQSCEQQAQEALKEYDLLRLELKRRGAAPVS